MSTVKHNRAVFKSLRCDWVTPQKLFDELDAEFHFELDVAADSDNAKCDRFFSVDRSAFSHRWAPAVCWMNPPYGPDLKKWMAKAWAEAQEGATVVCLVPARTDTYWWHDIALLGEIRFLRGRLRFDDGKGRATFPSVVIVLRPV